MNLPLLLCSSHSFLHCLSSLLRGVSHEVFPGCLGLCSEIGYIFSDYINSCY